MNPPALNFASIFETLPDPLAVCDEDGQLLAMNQRARQLLGAKTHEGIRLDLRARETVRQIRMKPGMSVHEFFLADVAVEGAERERVGASLHPLDDGNYRVTFSADDEPSTLNPNLRMMESLANLGRHLDLFKTLDKTLALFETSFADVFTTYGFRLFLDGEVVRDHRGWEGQEAAAGDANLDPEARHVPRDEFVFPESHRAFRVALRGLSELRGFVQFERREDQKFGVSERQAFETFVQQLSLALLRVAGEPSLKAVGPIIDQLDAIVVVCDARRRILVSNRTFEALVGSADVEGRDIVEFFDTNGGSILRTTAASTLAGGQAEAFSAHLLHDRHEPLALRVQIAPTHPREGDTASGFIMTGQQSELSLVELEDRMNRAEQLMNVGQLASGVAHELKNPLTSILNYAEYLLVKYQGTLFEERDSDRLRRIIDGVERIDTFVRELVTLARPSDAETRRVDLHVVLRESSLMCEVALRQTATKFRVDLDEESPFVMGSPHQLKQVFVNLIANAATSMPEGGGNIVVSTRVESGWVRCEVADDAVGMSAETLSRIFEPFFTTREGSGGSGLGLALVKTIVHHHGGEVAVESERGRGTTFSIRLPLADE